MSRLKDGDEGIVFVGQLVDRTSTWAEDSFAWNRWDILPIPSKPIVTSSWAFAKGEVTGDFRCISGEFGLEDSGDERGESDGDTGELADLTVGDVWGVFRLISSGEQDREARPRSFGDPSMFSVGGGQGVILRTRVIGDIGASFWDSITPHDVPDIFLAASVGEPGGVLKYSVKGENVGEEPFDVLETFLVRNGDVFDDFLVTDCGPRLVDGGRFVTVASFRNLRAGDEGTVGSLVE